MKDAVLERREAVVRGRLGWVEEIGEELSTCRSWRDKERE